MNETQISPGMKELIDLGYEMAGTTKPAPVDASKLFPTLGEPASPIKQYLDTLTAGIPERDRPAFLDQHFASPPMTAELAFAGLDIPTAESVALNLAAMGYEIIKAEPQQHVDTDAGGDAA